MYSYNKSIKSELSDELVNTYVLRPIAGLIVKLLYSTPVTPNHVTIASIAAGFISALFYLKGTEGATAAAGFFIILKDILDSADGQLARAKQQYSRIGRFLDSIGDFLVNVAVFGSIGFMLYRSSGDPMMLLLAVLGLTGITLRVSYHVFYQVNFLHLHDKYRNNRIIEEVQEDDITKGGFELMLQRLFQMIYGWQDRLIGLLDAWSRKKKIDPDFLLHWYSDSKGLRMSGLLGFGTELSILMLCSFIGRLELYFYINLFLMNFILLVTIFYRRFFLLPALLKKGLYRNKLL